MPTGNTSSSRRRGADAVGRGIALYPPMRLGILSDIHANYEALSAVLEAYRDEAIDVYYCLGDTVGYGGSPDEC